MGEERGGPKRRGSYRRRWALVRRPEVEVVICISGEIQARTLQNVWKDEVPLFPGNTMRLFSSSFGLFDFSPVIRLCRCLLVLV